ncbi:MAG: methyltransferase domain-containing protein [Dehalococcoidia bacterium]|nr:methyltransferase domain-containing protein [Dehalococcoidia bacterium]
MTTATNPDPAVLEEKIGVAWTVMGGLANAHMVHIGGTLGLYRAMYGAGPLSSAQLAGGLGLAERFVREWLYQQSALGVVKCHAADSFELSAEAGLVFADENFPLTLAAVIPHIPAWFETGLGAVEAFKTGRGRPFDGMGERGARILDSFFSGWNRAVLVPEALPKIPGAVEALRRGGMVADVGCGAGAAPIAIASAFPDATVHGYDNSVHALRVAEEARCAAGVTNVSFHNPDTDPLPGIPTFDLVLTLDCLHDMARPDLVAAAIRRAIKPDGVWFIVDFDASPSPHENVSHPMGAMLFASSLLACLQSSASTPDGMALGPTGLPEGRMREMVAAAGFGRFSRVEGLTHPMNAFYEVRP